MDSLLLNTSDSDLRNAWYIWLIMDGYKTIIALFEMCIAQAE